MTKFDEKMSEFFDVEPATNNVPTIIGSSDVIKHETLDVDFKNDYITVRNNFHELIDTGKNALENLLAVAQDSEKSRDYEVSANLLKSILDANEQLINIHKKVRDISNYKQSLEIQNNQQTNIENAVFVGSTSELSKIISELKTKEINN